MIATVALAGCQTDGTLPTSGKAMVPLSEKMVAEIDGKNMDKDSPILIRTFKEESELEVWKQDRTGRYALLKSYPICRWSGELGPKFREGDRQAPEGFYTITPAQMNPNSQYYLSFDLGYPNAFDRAHGRTGANLMVHGDCSSRGCYSMTDEQIAEIYALGREAFFGGQRAFQVQAYPFRMTAKNLAKHRSNPHMAFWKMLKRGSDHFEVTHLEPKVNVCDKRYVFDAEPPAGSNRPLSFNPAGRCPVYEISEEITVAVQEKQQRDDAQYAELVRRNTPVAPVRMNVDGGMHPVFVDAVKRNQIGVKPAAVFSLAAQAPGTIPVTVRPPRIPELADVPIVADAPPPPPPVRAAAAPAPTRTASAEPPPQTTSSIGSLFSNLFSSKEAPAAAEPKDNDEGGALSRMARAVGLRGTNATAARSGAVPAPKPKPTTRTASTGAPATPRPKPAEPEPAPAVATIQISPPPARAAAAFPDPPAPRPASKPAPSATAAASPSTMSGAAPVVPSGNFENRWSGFR
jgi:murein L,D-transpeptidase YafK